jgi:hypothetical protein
MEKTMNKKLSVGILLAIAFLTMFLYASLVLNGITRTIALTNNVEVPYTKIEKDVEKPDHKIYKGLALEQKDEREDAKDAYLREQKGNLIARVNKEKEREAPFSSTQSMVFGIIAGIITSIVTAVFAVTKPSKLNPGSHLVARAFGQNDADYAKKPFNSAEKITSLLTNLYILCWFAFGGACFYFCFYNVGDGMPKISLVYEHGRLWFGLAAGAIISLLAINPAEDPN